MVDVWPGKDFPAFARLDLYIPTALYLVGYMCIVVDVPVAATFMYLIGFVLSLSLKMPVYLVESTSDNFPPKLVNGLDILRSRVFYCFSDIVISGPYWSKKLELLRMDFAETESRVGKFSEEGEV